MQHVNVEMSAHLQVKVFPEHNITFELYRFNDTSDYLTIVSLPFFFYFILYYLLFFLLILLEIEAMAFLLFVYGYLYNIVMNLNKKKVDI